MGFYLPQFNWSVVSHNGEWCLFARQKEDKIAETSQQIEAIHQWSEGNRAKHIQD